MAELEAAKKRLEERMLENANLKQEFDRMRESYARILQEKEQLEQKLQAFQKHTNEKIKKLEDEIQSLNKNFDGDRKRLEDELKKERTRNAELQKSNRDHVNAYSKLEKELAGKKRTWI